MNNWKEFLEKLSKMQENIKILNLSQEKEEGTIWYQNQIIILQSFSQKFFFFFYDNDIHKTLILNNKKLKQIKNKI